MRLLQQDTCQRPTGFRFKEPCRQLRAALSVLVAFYFRRLDARGPAFIDTPNTRLLLIEDEASGG